MESALAYLNIVAIHIGNVGRSVCRIPTVHSIGLARITSVWIPASEFAARTRNAQLSIMCLLVAASKITKAIRSSSVNACNVSLPSFYLLPEKLLPLKKPLISPPYISIARVKPCEPSPCGPNSVCREFGEQASCSCLPGYFGIPPSCRPECLVSTDCEQSKACVNMRCRNPCESTCGQNALCVVRNHNPICRCPIQHSGDPFVNCFPISK